MKRKYVVAVGAMLAIAAGVFWISQAMGRRTPARSAARALSGGRVKDRVSAVAELSAFDRSQSLALMQDVAAKAQEPEVKAAALRSLARFSDTSSYPLFLAAMEHDDPAVRSAGLAGVKLQFGGDLPDDLEFLPDDPPDKRTKVIQRIKQHQEEEKGRLAAAVVVAANPNTDPAPSPMSSSKTSPDAATKPSSDPAPPSPPTTAPSPALPPPGPLVQYDYPAIHVIYWMCRVLAVLVLFAEVAGALILLLGDRSDGFRAKDKAGHKGPLTPEEQMERILARMGTSMWSKIGMLVAGAISIVALLYAGEMIYVAVRMEQTAGRVEQKIDNLRGR